MVLGPDFANLLTGVVGASGLASLCYLAVALVRNCVHRGRVWAGLRLPGSRLPIWIGFAIAVASPASAQAFGSRRPSQAPHDLGRRTATPPWSDDLVGPTIDRAPDGVPQPRTSNRSPHAPAPPWSESAETPPPRPAGSDQEAAGSEPSRLQPHDTAVGSAHGVTYVVRPGDSLWRIAASALGTGDPARIARYWQSIHRVNREVVGYNPNLIFAGQILTLPDEPRL
jgi:hypothetical protein